MVFSSSVFIFCFLPLVFAFYFLARGKYRNIVLLISSLLFYAWGEPKHILLMCLSILMNFLFGVLVEPNKRHRRFSLVLAVTYNLGMLFVFKYLNFTVMTLSQVMGRSFNIPSIPLPIGISFYTFQIMSYVIDVYRGTVIAQKNILNLGLYISLFPQLIAGPIVRYVDVEKQIVTRSTEQSDLYYGLRRFCIGFSKKVLLADQLALLVDTCFSGEYASVLVNWTGAISYTLQIYYDFSGYSDMAIGLGRMFGFRFLENFKYPYIAVGIQEFWRRWHISLSSWFRDYLYIPLGGNRKGKTRALINQYIVFFLTGLWHGASWNFVVWGLYHGTLLTAEKIIKGPFSSLRSKRSSVVSKLCFRTLTMLLVVIGWVFFRAETLGSAIHYIRGMFIHPGVAGKGYVSFLYVMNRQYFVCLIAGIMLCAPYIKVKAFLKRSTALTITADVLLVLIFILAICYMVGGGYSPFLYFRF